MVSLLVHRSRRQSIWLALALAGLALAALVVAGRPAPAGAQAVSVSIQNFAFGPATLQVSAGTTVTWTNNDSVAHTVTADDGSFDSGSIAPGGTFSHTFDTAGTVTYHCSIHPFMKAEIDVAAATSGGSTSQATAMPSGNGAEATAMPATDMATAMPASNVAPASNAPAASGATSLPNTGAGTTSSHHSMIELIAAFLLVLLGTAGALGHRRRRTSR